MAAYGRFQSLQRNDRFRPKTAIQVRCRERPLAIVFLGYYAISLNSAPLYVIIGAILFMVCRDYYQSVRKGNQKSEK